MTNGHAKTTATFIPLQWNVKNTQNSVVVYLRNDRVIVLTLKIEVENFQTRPWRARD